MAVSYGKPPKLTLIETLTQGLMRPIEEIRANFSIKEDGKGRGVYLKIPLLKQGSFVCEYEGEVIKRKEARMREEIYAGNNEGCFQMDFLYNGQKLTIDATRQFDSYTRLLNHSKKPNIKFCSPLVVDFEGPPRIGAYALRDIRRGEEIVFDYGVRDKDISWLQNEQAGFAEVSEGEEMNDEINDDAASKTPSQDGYICLRFTSARQAITKDGSKYNEDSSSESSSGESKTSSKHKKCRSDRTKHQSKGKSLPGVQRKESPVKRHRISKSECSIKFYKLSNGTVEVVESKLATPRKILKCVEDVRYRKRKTEENDSVISLSDDSSPSQETLSSGSTSTLPTIPELSFKEKVMDWQNCPMPQIVGVQSLSDSPLTEEQQYNSDQQSPVVSFSPTVPEKLSHPLVMSSTKPIPNNLESSSADVMILPSGCSSQQLSAVQLPELSSLPPETNILPIENRPPVFSSTPCKSRPHYVSSQQRLISSESCTSDRTNATPPHPKNNLSANQSLSKRVPTVSLSRLPITDTVMTPLSPVSLEQGKKQSKNNLARSYSSATSYNEQKKRQLRNNESNQTIHSTAKSSKENDSHSTNDTPSIAITHVRSWSELPTLSIQVPVHPNSDCSLQQATGKQHQPSSKQHLSQLTHSHSKIPISKPLTYSSIAQQSICKRHSLQVSCSRDSGLLEKSHGNQDVLQDSQSPSVLEQQKSPIFVSRAHRNDRNVQNTKGSVATQTIIANSHSNFPPVSKLRFSSQKDKSQSAAEPKTNNYSAHMSKDASVKRVKQIENHSNSFQLNNKQCSSHQSVQDVLVVSEDDSDIEIVEPSKKIATPNISSSDNDCILVQEESPQLSPTQRDRKQIAVIRPFAQCDKSQQQGNQLRASGHTCGTSTINEFEKTKLEEIFKEHISLNIVSQEDIQETIFANWDFFRSIIERGISLDEIRDVVLRLFK